MKKKLLLEVIIITALIMLAIVLGSRLTQPALAPAGPVPDASGETTTEESTQETTSEPEPTWFTVPSNRTLSCSDYVVYDLSGNYFGALSGQYTDRVYPASITKLFTAYTAMWHLRVDKLITAGDELDMVVWGSSVAGIKKGDTLTVEQLIEAMLLPSGNDAAYVLAAAAGRDIREDPNLSAQAAVNAFMEEMNSMAASVGMIDAHFVNPDGIHDQQHYMSLYDIALLGLLVYDNPTISKYAALPVGNNPRYTEPAQGETENTSDDAPKQWKNTNELIQPDSVYYCPYATGMKTGQTPNAGSCLLSSFNYKGRVLIIGVFGCEEKDDRFVDTLQLFNEAIGTS